MIGVFWPLAAVLVACRFYAFRPYLDHPHLFRQADTAFYSLGFYRFGMNILTPSVGWLGDHRRLVLEFPLTEWLTALVYSATGPTILVDRLVNLGFFLGSAFFLHQIVELVHDRVLARLATLAYLAAPLGIYYSRAVHVDFTAVCFAHAFLYYTLRFVVAGGTRHAGLAAASGAVAVAIKVPYAFYLVLPILLVCLQERAGWRRVAQVGLILVVPAAAFVGWFVHARSVNSETPDLSFIPGYFSHVDRFAWYFGTLADRWMLDPWRTVAGRVHREIASTVWWAALPLGLLAWRRLGRYYAFVLAWSAGTVVYLVIFLNLNERHNYYQIPFIAPFSLWLAGAAYACWSADARILRRGQRMAAALLIAYAGSSMAVAVTRFYRTEPLHPAIGEFVRRHTAEEDLVVMAYAEAEYADPSFLFQARRYGWSVDHGELTPAVIEGLLVHGATTVVTSTLWPPGPGTMDYLATRSLAGVFPVEGGEIRVHRLPDRGGSRR
jgi:hypothetical protein